MADMHIFDTVRTQLAIGAAWQVLPTPAVALVTGFLLRPVLRARLAAARAPLAALAGLLAAVGPLAAFHQMLVPHGAAGLLLPVAGATVAGLLPIPLPALAAVGSWWLLGAPSTLSGLLSHLLALLLVGLGIWAGGQGTGAADRWQQMLACATLGGGLAVCGLAAPWLALGLLPLAASLSAAGRGGRTGDAPLGLVLGLVASLVCLREGRLPHGGVSAVDLAAAAPLAVLHPPAVLARLGPRGGAALTLVLAICATFALHRFGGL